MRFHATNIPGVFTIGIDPIQDERGFFARAWCRNEFEAHGLESNLMQANISYNLLKGTLRGMHYQAPPFAESKLVRCTQGAIYDVVLDLRPESPSFKDWIAVTLAAENRNMIYVPKRCAHGFLTLQDETEVFYQMSEVYNAESSRGVRWNDPAFGIAWPERVEVLSERDRNYPDFK
jgi:dTDP-4-dehydrorhamnose 3,5-epimerase